MTDTSVELINVSVSYPVIGTRGITATSALANFGRGKIYGVGRRTEVQALKNINLSVGTGKRIGIIGRNGSGKTTLLRVLATALPPTSGQMRIVGNISSMLDLHSNIEPNATGLANAQIRLLQMGFKGQELTDRLKSISEFSELDQYLHMPIRSYSAGMRMRLLFSIATSVDPEIMVLDEWLAAGDEAFRTRVAERMNNLVEKSNILFLASHSRPLLRDICNWAIVMDSGSIVFEGEVDEGFEFFEKTILTQKAV